MPLRVHIWLQESQYPTQNLSGGLRIPYSLFVSDIADVYVDNGGVQYRVDKWESNATNSVPVMHVNGTCYGVFIDVTNHLHCSMQDYHQVLKQSLNSSTNASTIAAGMGVNGSNNSTLNLPQGIFIDVYLRLFVADCRNNRIQRFQSDPFDGTTIVGNGAPGTITLRCPSSIVLDADSYLFIVDADNNPIVGSGPNDYRCLVGCSQVAGSAADQLNYPGMLSFDSFGNIFVTDWSNARIQNFSLATNSCGKSYPITAIKSHRKERLLTKTNHFSIVDLSLLEATTTVADTTQSTERIAGN